MKSSCPKSSPKLYDTYQAVYDDPDVDVVYIGTPHAFHKQNVLDAIAAGKNILCEKPLTINAREAREVFEAARAKGVYLHEAMWLRHRPLVHKLRRLLHEDKIIGDVYRSFVDFAIEVDIASLPSTSRYKDLSLGAGTLLDIGIYSITWAILTLDPGSPTMSEKPLALGIQSHQDGVEMNTSALLQYPSTGRQGIVTSTNYTNGHPNVFATIWGTNGVIEVEGPAPSLPFSFTVYPKLQGDPNSDTMVRGEGKKYDFPKIGMGFIHEADNTALDILAGRKESQIVPWSETMYAPPFDRSDNLSADRSPDSSWKSWIQLGSKVTLSIQAMTKSCDFLISSRQVLSTIQTACMIAVAATVSLIKLPL